MLKLVHIPLGLALTLGVALTGPALADPACQTPIFADWGLLMLPFEDGLPCEEQEPFEYEPCQDYTYVPHPGGGHGPDPTDVRTTCLYDRVTEAGAPRGVMIRNRNCPFPYSYEPHTPAPHAIDSVLAYVPDMEFAFMDLEGHTLEDVEPNVLEVVARARAVNPDIRAGNYNYFPGTYDGSRPRESQADRTSDPYGADLDEIYRTSGLDVAMPSCYPYEYYEAHVDPGQYGGSSPNERSALFWAPLERLSVAKRALPSGHMLVPMVTPFVSWSGYEATPPAPEDVEALPQHLRLRGADAFYAWSTGADDHPYFFTSQHYRQFVLTAWHALDDYFEGADSIEVLNLTTNKTGGVEWSGIRSEGRVVILASNLGPDEPAVVDLPEIEGLPDTVQVPRGEHLLFAFDLAACCLPDGSCVVATESDCWTQGGTWQVGWTSCDPDPCATSAVGEDTPALGSDAIRLAARPNPSLGTTRITFHVESEAYVTLQIYDVSGRLARTLVSSVMAPGEHHVDWGGDLDGGGHGVPGAYLCRFRAGGAEETLKILRRP